MYSFGGWHDPRPEHFVPEEIENKEKTRQELKRLVSEYIKNGGAISVYGVSSSDVISRREIKEKYGVTNKDINKWVREMKFPAKIGINSKERLKCKSGRIAAREDDKFYAREVEVFFKNGLYDMRGYERFILISKKHK